jgi:hypothetical protein
MQHWLTNLREVLENNGIWGSTLVAMSAEDAGGTRDWTHTSTKQILPVVSVEHLPQTENEEIDIV